MEIGRVEEETEGLISYAIKEKEDACQKINDCQRNASPHKPTIKYLQYTFQNKFEC